MREEERDIYRSLGQRGWREEFGITKRRGEQRERAGGVWDHEDRWREKERENERGEKTEHRGYARDTAPKRWSDELESRRKTRRGERQRSPA